MPRFNPDDYRGLTQDAPRGRGLSALGSALQFVGAGVVAFGIIYLTTPAATSLLAGVFRATTPPELRSSATANPSPRVPSARESIARMVDDLEGPRRRQPRADERALAPHEVRFLLRTRDENQFQYEMIVHRAGVTVVDPRMLPDPGFDPTLSYAIEMARRVRQFSDDPCNGTNRRVAAAHINRFLHWLTSEQDRELRPRTGAIFDHPDGRIIRDVLVDRVETGRLSLDDFGLAPPVPVKTLLRNVRVVRPQNCPQR